MTTDLRAQVMVCAARLFVERGYHGLSMREIAEAVSVTKAALYYHFTDKEALFLAILMSYLDQIQAALDQIMARETSTRSQVLQLVSHLLSQPVEQRAMIRMASQEMSELSPSGRQALHQAYHQKFIYKIQAILQRGSERGELRPMHPALATWLLLGMMYPYLYTAHIHEIPPAAKVALQITSVYLDGIAVRDEGKAAD